MKSTIIKQDCPQEFVGKLIQTLFSGSASKLIMQALGNHKPTDQDLVEIKSLIEQLQNK